jgi:hypothetical protein
MDSAAVREIERAITSALSRRGIAGKLTLSAGVAELSDTGTKTVSVGLGWVEQWHVLPPDLQDRRVESAAKELKIAIDRARGKIVLPSIDAGPFARKAMTAAALVAGVAIVGWWLHGSGFFGSSSETDEGAASANPIDLGPDDERLARSCEAGRKRLAAGASMGVDIEGWVVELWLARPADEGELMPDTTLRSAVRDGAKFVAGKTAKATLVRGEGAGPLGMQSAVLRLVGDYVTAFFEQSRRPSLERWAGELAVDAAVDHAALYARCAHLKTHDAGAWYFGRNDTGATVSLLYGAGVFGTPPAFERSAFQDGGGLLQALSARVSKLDDAQLNDAMRAQGGRFEAMALDGDAGTVSVLRFPFGGATRPLRASRSLARTMLEK